LMMQGPDNRLAGPCEADQTDMQMYFISR
jgi:hypothetical protein